MRLPLQPLIPVLALVFGACQTSAPSLTPAASPSGLDVRRLPVGVQTAEMTMIVGDQSRTLGTVEYQTARVASAPAHLTIVATQRFAQGPPMVDTLVVDVPGGRPVRYRNGFGDRQTIRVDYGTDGTISGRTTRNGQTTARDTTVRGAVLDAAQLRPLLAALPLAAGLRTTLPTYDYQTGTVVMSRVEVADARVPGTEDAAWDVSYTTPSGVTSHVWIDRETRQTRRIEADLGNGRRYVEVFR